MFVTPISFDDHFLLLVDPQPPNDKVELPAVMKMDNIVAPVPSTIIESGSFIGRDASGHAEADAQVPFTHSAILETSQEVSVPSADTYAVDNPIPDWPKSPLGNVLILLKIICFIPWCIAVGGAIILCPNQLVLVAFGAGYQSSLKGIKRFAYWADSAMQHLVIFCGFVATVAWWNQLVGGFLLTGIMAAFLFAWGDFVLDRNIPLGQDDRQTIFLVVTNYGLPDDSLVFQHTADGYLARDGRKMH